MQPSRFAPLKNALSIALPATGALLATEAHAQTVWSVNQTVTVNDALRIDVDGQTFSFSDDANAELQLRFDWSNSPKPLIVAFENGSTHGDGLGYVTNLANGTLIDASLMVGDVPNNALYINYNGANDANWAAGTQGYVGFNFTDGGTTYYGYADVTYTNDQKLYVGNVGYQADGILAGAPAAVPESSTAALMAGLVAGSATLLRRRQQRQAAPAAA